MKREMVRIYKSSRDPQTYLYLKKNSDFETLPLELREIFGRPIKVTDMLLAEDRKLARADAAKVLAELEDKGFYLQMPPPKEEYMLDLFREKRISDHG